ncbi:MAG: hypothetical protein WCO82_05140 [Sphingomonadales bacterium]
MCDAAAMFNILSLLIGLFALFLSLFAFLPFLGWANWAIIPLAMVGMGLGAISDGNAGRNLNVAVIAIGAFRLFMGGGLF